MAEVEADLGPVIEDSGATLVVEELPEVQGDPRQLRRVLQNLVGNALKFRGEESPRIEVSALRGRHEWIVTVRDNGIGIDREHASRIFEMFSRVGRNVEGSGIRLGGLSAGHRGSRRAHLARAGRRRGKRVSLHPAVRPAYAGHRSGASRA